MPLPNVNIPRQQGQLKRVEPSADAVVCMLLTGAAVDGGVQLGVPYQIYGSAALAANQITAVNNPLAFTDITDFYLNMGEGAELNFMLVSDTTLLADICNKTMQLGKKLIDSTAGRAVIFIVNKKLPAGYNVVRLNGLDTDVWNAVTNLNIMAKQYDDNNVPFVAALPGIGFTVATSGALSSRSTLAFDFVAVSLACKSANGLVSMGLLAGIIANRQVHRNIARVEDGLIANGGYFPDGVSVIDPSIIDSLGAIHDKGYIIMRKIGDLAGYYFNDDSTLTAVSGDFTSLSWNRVINKAKRLAYAVLIKKLNDDIEVNPTTGLIETSLASDWESDVEAAIKGAMMRANGSKVKEISGVKCTIDPNSDVVNDQVDMTLQIVRKNQAKTINVKIGYTTTL